jgi:YesN/AraC family two-component response regulator
MARRRHTAAMLNNDRSSHMTTLASGARRNSGSNPGAGPATPKATETGNAGLKVFLVEDSAPIRERLAEIITDAGGMDIVGEAGSFNAAVAGILAARPDVAILDIKLAEGNGIDVLTEAKRQLPGLRGIILSNYTTPQHLKASVDAGADYFLDKSTDFDKIVGILKLMKGPVGG